MRVAAQHEEGTDGHDGMMGWGWQAGTKLTFRGMNLDIRHLQWMGQFCKKNHPIAVLSLTFGYRKVCNYLVLHRHKVVYLPTCLCGQTPSVPCKMLVYILPLLTTHHINKGYCASTVWAGLEPWFPQAAGIIGISCLLFGILESHVTNSNTTHGTWFSNLTCI
jgi:hypothetical protein